MKNQFITNDNGTKIAVILPINDYDKIMDALDEYACIKAYDKVKARKQEFIPAEEMFKAVEAKRSR